MSANPQVPVDEVAGMADGRARVRSVLDQAWTVWQQVLEEENRGCSTALWLRLAEYAWWAAAGEIVALPPEHFLQLATLEQDPKYLMGIAQGVREELRSLQAQLRADAAALPPEHFLQLATLEQDPKYLMGIAQGVREELRSLRAQLRADAERAGRFSEVRAWHGPTYSAIGPCYEGYHLEAGAGQQLVHYHVNSALAPKAPPEVRLCGCGAAHAAEEKEDG